MHCTMMYSPTVTRTTLNMAAAIRRVQERRGERFKFIESERLALTEVQSEMQIYTKWEIQTLSSPLKCSGITCFHSAVPATYVSGVCGFTRGGRTIHIN